MLLSTPLSYFGNPRETADQVVALERAGLDQLWVAEPYGFDAVSLLGYLAAKTETVQLGSGILNIYSRTPGALLQTAAGLDNVSSGRAILGLGASGPQVIEGFHGVAYDKPLGRTREIVDILRRGLRGARSGEPSAVPQLTLGQHIADDVAATMGSWRFIIIQSLILLVWIVLNVTAYVQQWDPYPFILLNLALSFQAAYAAPFIMMSQNRQQDIDRKSAEDDFKINIKAELEIELLHQKIDQLRETEVLQLTQAVKELTELLRRTEAKLGPAATA